jgi:hypothetical protein
MPKPDPTKADERPVPVAGQPNTDEAWLVQITNERKNTKTGKTTDQANLAATG